MNILIRNKISQLLFGLCLITLSACFHDQTDTTVGTGNGSDTTDDKTVTETITQSGGDVVHSTGFTASFPDAALPVSTDVTISEVSMPSSLPANILAGIRAYKIDGLDDVDLDMPVTISFSQANVNTSLPEGALGVYRWDDTEWSFVGGVLDTQAGTVSTEISAFSVFVLGTGASLHKTITFSNGDLLYDYVASPYQYSLAHPTMDSPISSLSVAVFARAGYTGRMSLAQGIYTFCIDWDTGIVDENDRIIYNHRFMGSYPDNPAITITEDTNDTVPPLLFASVTGATFVGRCPGPVNMGPTVDAGTGVNLGDPEVTLTWNNDNDLDLWVSGPSGNIGWEDPGPATDTARLDVDDVCDEDIMIGGPEHIYWSGQSNLLTGTYQVWVNHFEQCSPNPDPVSLPRLRLVMGNDVDFFPGTDVATDLVMRPDGTAGPNWCLIYEFQRGVWPPAKCGRDFQNCCINSLIPPI